MRIFKKLKDKDLKKRKENLKICAFWINSVIGHKKVTIKNFGKILSDGIIISNVFYKLSDCSDALERDFYVRFSQDFDKLANIKIIIKKIEREGKMDLNNINQIKFSIGDEMEILKLVQLIVRYWGLKGNKKNSFGLRCFDEWTKTIIDKNKIENFYSKPILDNILNPEFIYYLINAMDSTQDLNEKIIYLKEKDKIKLMCKRMNKYLWIPDFLKRDKFSSGIYTIDSLIFVLSTCQLKYFWRLSKRNFDSLALNIKEEIYNILNKHLKKCSLNLNDNSNLIKSKINDLFDDLNISPITKKEYSLNLLKNKTNKIKPFKQVILKEKIINISYVNNKEKDILIFLEELDQINSNNELCSDLFFYNNKNIIWTKICEKKQYELSILKGNKRIETDLNFNKKIICFGLGDISGAFSEITDYEEKDLSSNISSNN